MNLRSTLLCFITFATFDNGLIEAFTPENITMLENRQNNIMDQLRIDLRRKALTDPDMVNYVIKRFKENLDEISHQHAEGQMSAYIDRYEVEYKRHKKEVEKVYVKAVELLTQKFPQDIAIVEFIVTSLRENKIVEKAYNETNFNEFILANIVQYESEFLVQRREQDEETRNRTIIEAAYNAIRRKLDDRKPSAPEFNRKFVDFLMTEKAHEDNNFFGILLDTSSFDLFIKRHLLQFTRQNDEVFLTAIHYQIRHLLITDYSYDFQTTTNILNTITKANPTFSSELIYDINRLKMRIYPYVTQYKWSIFDKLETNLDSWYPAMKKYNRRFLFYLKSKNTVNIKDVDDMSENKIKFLQKAQIYFSEFSNIYQVDIRKEIMENVKILLNDEFRNHQSAHNTIIEELKGDHTLEDTFKMDLLYDLEKFRRVMKPIIRRLIMKLDEMD